LRIVSELRLMGVHANRHARVGPELIELSAWAASLRCPPRMTITRAPASFARDHLLEAR
jgi:hypothetical protein